MQEHKIRRLVVLYVRNGPVTFRMHQMLRGFLLKTIIIVEIQISKKNLGVIRWIQIYDGNFVPHDMMQKKKIGVNHIMSVWSRIYKIKSMLLTNILSLTSFDDQNVVTNIFMIFKKLL